MKHWLVQFSIKFIDGSVKGGRITLEAPTITIALVSVFRNIRDPMMIDDNFKEFVVWDICLVDDEIF